MRRLIASLSFAFAVSVAAAGGASANLVTNGSFELGANGLQGWTIGGADAQGFPPVAIFYNNPAAYPGGAFGEAVPTNNAPTNSPDAAGLRAAYFVSDRANNQSLSQSVFLTAGLYQIGFSGYLPQNGFNNAGDATFVGNIAGVTLASFAASAGTPLVWQTFSGAANILADGLYSVDFVFNTNNVPSKDVVIDQVYIIAGNPPVAVPEPATLALFGAALLGLGAVRRARRRRT